MMISPEIYIKLLEDKSYEGLIRERDYLISEIRTFENQKDNVEIELVTNTSLEVSYQYNLQYLAKLCELMVATYKDVSVWKKEEIDKEVEWIYIIKNYLSDMQIYESAEENVIARKNGKVYSLSDHLKGLIYSLLSNQRQWTGIVPHLSEIDAIFYHYDVDKVKETEGTVFVNELRKIKCGNRSINYQMKNLCKNIEIMEQIEQDYGSMDIFVTSAPAYEIVHMLSSNSSKYKLYNIGEALAWEYLRNVGIDGAKPDVHLCRFFGSNRMGTGNNSPASVQEVYEIVLNLSEKTGLSMSAIDALIWNYCADGYGEICTVKPKCQNCPISDFCNKNSK